MADLGRCYGLRWTAKRGSTCDRRATHDLAGMWGIPGYAVCCDCYAIIAAQREVAP